MKKKCNLLIICSIISGIIMIYILYGVILWVQDIYVLDPFLKNLTLTKILGYGNFLPAIAVAVCTARYSFMLKKNTHIIAEFLKTLKKLFFLQAGYTFVSISIIGIIENAGPAVVVLATGVIVFISLTLALIFSIISEVLLSEQ